MSEFTGARRRTIWRFGTFELDEATLELRKAGRRVALAAQPARALLLLVSRAGEVVSREELQRSLWGEGTFVHFPSSLAFCLGRVRRALGDDARSPRFVETIPKLGYRFLAPVVRVEADPAQAAVAVSRWPRRFGRVAAAALVAGALLEPGGLVAHTRRTASPEALAAFERAQKLAGGDALERRRSVYSYRDAIRQDPRFAEAHYALAEVYVGLGERGELASATALEQAGRHAQAALALEEMPETHLLLASARWFHDWNWTGARHELESALRLAPDADAVLVAYARHLSAAGDDAGAIRAVDRAEAGTPGCDLVAHESGIVRFRARLWDEAVRKFDLAASLGPPRGWARADWQRANRFFVFRIHLHQQAWQRAQADAVEIVRLATGRADAADRLAALPARDAVERFLAGNVDHLRRLSEREYVPRTDLARSVALAGQGERALDLLDDAAARREPQLVASLRDPDFDSLRVSPRFVALLTRVGALTESR